MIDFKQSVFTFHQDIPYDENDFVITTCNQNAHNFLLNPNIPYAPFYLLQGAQGSGKSHLARLWQNKNNALFIDFNTKQSPYDILSPSSFFLTDPIIFANDPALEEKIFHFYNVAKELNASILLVLETPLSATKLQLKDLESRLKASPLLTILQPDDEMLKFLIVKQLSDRQISLDATLLDFLMKRIERSFKIIPDLVAQIDALSLECQRKITIPLLKEVLENLNITQKNNLINDKSTINVENT
jgi:chromosomal replication initiation ATPase DnaA